MWLWLPAWRTVEGYEEGGGREGGGHIKDIRLWDARREERPRRIIHVNGSLSEEQFMSPHLTWQIGALFQSQI